MVEVVHNIIKFITAFSLQILSFSLIVWVLNLKPAWGIKQIGLGLLITILVYFFVSYSLALFQQIFNPKKNNKKTSEILDEDEISTHKEHD